MNPSNDGNIVRLTVPTLTEERRAELIKVIHKIIEDGRVSIRNLRRDANDKLKSLEKDIYEEKKKPPKPERPRSGGYWF